MGQAASKTQEEELHFLLMGKTGHGKSTLGNCILGCETFEVTASATSHTQEVKSGYSKFQKYLLKVVDGPGLEHTQLDKITNTKKAIKTINTALVQCHEGFDAVLFVFKFGTRFTQEEVSTIETLKKLFGDDYYHHVIVVITGLGQFKDLVKPEKFKGSFDDWCMKQTGPFKELYDAIEKRFIFFNSFEEDKQKQIAQKEQLTTLAHNLKYRHGRYTSDCFRLAATERARMITELNAPILKEDIQRQAGLLFSTLHEYIQTANEESTADIKLAIQNLKEEYTAEIKLAIQNLKDEITKEDKCKDLLADLTKVVSNIEKSLNDKDKLVDHAMELDQTRTANKYWNLAHDVISTFRS